MRHYLIVFFIEQNKTGLGISMGLMSYFLTVYYAMLIAYAILYLILSFRSKLEWTTCGPWASASMSHMVLE